MIENSKVWTSHWCQRHKRNELMYLGLFKIDKPKLTILENADPTFDQQMRDDKSDQADLPAISSINKQCQLQFNRECQTWWQQHWQVLHQYRSSISSIFPWVSIFLLIHLVTLRFILFFSPFYAFYPIMRKRYTALRHKATSVAFSSPVTVGPSANLRAIRKSST